MESRVTIRRKTSATTQDPTSGLEVPVWAITYTDHPFRLDEAGRSGIGGQRSETVGGVTRTLGYRIAHLPASTDDLADRDFVEITSGENAGLVLMVVESTSADQKTARRCPVVEAQRPTEWGA